MNVFKKIYCRVFQGVFRIALPILPYREPQRSSSISDVTEILDSVGAERVMLVTDKGLRGAGATEPLEKLLSRRKITCVVYDETQPNPTVNNVESALELYRKQGCEAIIAFGGGSSMDCAKALGARLAYPKKPLSKLKGLLKVLRKTPLLIAIPTTAGTGSEVTLASVITDSEKKHKYTLLDFTLIPDYAILDPKMTYSLPPQLTATTGMDALTHAIEAYIGRSTTRETRAKALEAVSLIFKNIELAYKNGRDFGARSAMLRASYLAGDAFSKSYVGYIHAIAHSLGGQYNTPHGLANAVIMPIVLEEYGKCAYKKLHALAISAGVSSPSDTHEQGAKKLIAEIRALNHRMGLPEHLNEIKAEDIPHMANHADKEANPLYPVPRLMNARELEKFYHLIKGE